MDADRWERRMNRRHRSGASGVIMGGVIVGLGLLLLLENLRIVEHDVWRFWPVLLIAYGVSRVLLCNTVSGYAWGGAVVLIGALILLNNLRIRTFDFNLIWPILLIAFGGSMLFRAIERKKYLDGAPGSANPNLGLWAIFSGVKRQVTAQDFQGGEVTAIFGGVQIDLRHAGIAGERAVIDANVLFGGVEIRVPETWSVNLKGIGIFGAFDDKTVRPRVEPGAKIPELVITGHALFGGAKIEN